MGIKSITTDVVGQIGVKPRRVSIITTDSLATVTTAGYLNSVNLMGYTIEPTDEIVMWYDYVDSTDPGTMGIFNAVMSGSSITLVEWVNPGDVVTPTVVDNVAIFNSTSGQLIDSGVHFSNLSYTEAPTLAASQTDYLPVFKSDGSLDKVSAGGTVISPGNIQAGVSGTPGALASFPPTASKGSLLLKADDNTGDTITALRNAPMGQACTLTFPDPGASSANVLLDTGSANILTDNQQWVSILDVLFHTTGTWTIQRNGTADYVLTKAANAETTISAFDITHAFRTTASKGFQLNSIDVVYGIATSNLVAHTAALYRVSFANNTALTPVNIPLTGSLATATQTNLYVTNLAVTTPAYLTTANSKLVLEITTNAAAGTVFAFYGLNLHYSETIA